MNVMDLTMTSIETITAFDVVTKSYKFTLDELQNVTIANTQEVSEITGRQGRKLANLKRNKAVTISGSNGMISGGLMEVQTGSDFEHKATEVMWPDYMIVVNHRVTTEFKAVGTPGAEINEIYLREASGMAGKRLVQSDEAKDGTFTYDPKTKEIVLDDTIADGTEIVAYYKRMIIGDVLSNESDTYSGKCTLYIDALAEDKCANVYRVQFYVPKADFSGEFSFEMGDNQSVHEFSAESLAGACGGIGGMLWTYTVFGADSEDYKTGEENMTLPKGEEDAGYSKKASDLMEDDVQIAWNGLDGFVTGTFKNIEKAWTQLPGTPNTGHFFTLKLDEKYKGKPFEFLKNGEVAGSTPNAGDDEMFWVLRLDQNKKFAFKSDGELILSLDFTNATLA